MVNEQAQPDRDGSSAPEPWRGELPRSGPAPTKGEHDIVEGEMAEGKRSDSRQRADWTGANHEDTSASRANQAQSQAREEGMSDIAQQVGEGTENPS